MRCLRRNQVPFYWAAFSGNNAGTVSYAEPVKAKANISAAKDVAAVAVFGTDLNYDKVLCMPKDVPFDENAFLWIDSVPESDRQGNWTVPPDYIVKRIAKSLNYALVAVTKVNVSI